MNGLSYAVTKRCVVQAAAATGEMAIITPNGSHRSNIQGGFARHHLRPKEAHANAQFAKKKDMA